MPSDIADEIGYIKLRRKKIRATGIYPARQRPNSITESLYIRCIIAAHLPRNSSAIYTFICVEPFQKSHLIDSLVFERP